MMYHFCAYQLAFVYRPYLRDVLALQAGVLELLRAANTK